VSRSAGGWHDRDVRVPRGWSELTPAWFTEALAADADGDTVAEAYVVMVRRGTNSSATVRLRWAGGRGPSRVFVKREGSLLNRLALTALGAREAEARLALDRPDLPLEHPAFLAAAVDPRRLATVVVMEDVTLRGARPHEATTPLTVDRVASGLAGLARLHAAYWCRPLTGGLGFVRPWRLGPGWGPMAWGGFVHAQRRLRRLGLSLPACAGPVTLAHGFHGWARLAASGPLTLLHGDPHPGNTYALPDGTTGFYDWQLVRSGSWAHDVGYFMVSALSVADRRAHERDLLGDYLVALAAAGAEAPDSAEAWEYYRRSPAYGLGAWLQTLAGGGFQPVEVCRVTIERFAAAYADLRE